MPSLQNDDMPDDIYAALIERARRERRTLAQQAMADLARISERAAKRTRQATLEKLRASRPILGGKALDPVWLVRKARGR
jgi:hypothetical protein